MAILAIGMETLPADLVVGQGFAYVIHVVNLGPDAAANVAVTDLLSELVDATFLSSGCSRQGRLVSCFVGAIEPGAQRTIDIRVIAKTPAGPIINAASAQGTNTNAATALHLAFARRPSELQRVRMPMARL